MKHRIPYAVRSFAALRWTLLGALVFALPAPAQQAAAPAPVRAPVAGAAPAASTNAVQRTPEQTLELARTYLESTKKREAELRATVMELDKQTDARVDEIINLLKSVRDSTDSNTEVQHTKKQAVEALKRWLQVYAQERGRRIGQIQGGATAAAKADLTKEVAALDQEINQRVDQLVELAASMTTSEELKRYDTYYDDYSGVVTRERDEYRAARRQSSRADQVQSKVDEALEKAIEDLERQIILVPQRLPSDMQEPELARLHATLKEREADLRKLQSARPPAARQVGDREANRIDQDLREAQQEIRTLWTRLQSKANLLSVERQRRRTLESKIRALEKQVGAPAAASAPAAAKP